MSRARRNSDRVGDRVRQARDARLAAMSARRDAHNARMDAWENGGSDRWMAEHHPKCPNCGRSMTGPTAHTCPEGTNDER